MSRCRSFAPIIGANSKILILGSIPGVEVFYFHSTSPANARMNLAALAQEWGRLLQYLE